MNDLEQLSLRIRKAPDDLEAWKNILAIVDDPDKKRDCQKQIDRIIARRQTVPFICPQGREEMATYFAGELNEERAKGLPYGKDMEKVRMRSMNCPNCGAPLNIHINNAQGQIVDCPYCGSKVVLEDNLVEKNLQGIQPERQGMDPTTQVQNEMRKSFWEQFHLQEGHNNKWALASLVIGILCFGGFMFFPTLSLLSNLVGLIAGIIGVKSSSRKIANTGIVINSIGLLLNILVIGWLVIKLFQLSPGRP